MHVFAVLHIAVIQPLIVLKVRAHTGYLFLRTAVAGCSKRVKRMRNRREGRKDNRGLVVWLEHFVARQLVGRQKGLGRRRNRAGLCPFSEIFGDVRFVVIFGRVASQGVG